jgi:predicted HicB family RNase H-like nuclease
MAKEAAKLSLRIEPELRGRIEAAAVADHRSINNWVTTVLARWVDQQQTEGRAA